ncbi:OsmC family protein [Hymenobacter psychrophilus]|uniref:Osmotically inducible protein OsmC n=1 Tax=Hymenobacter psychrophilus TaxID=651662 RepID=A0A1H3FPU7_9BACT|nr:hypothetical protein [Hymenobacter psychrophilus]SDX92144.1 osmotically inducible protein OsmC [Hymenobacter psychrophilus]
MAYQRGNAVWWGDSNGCSEVWSQRGMVVRAVYAAGALVNGQKGTKPGELLATAHASCFHPFSGPAAEPERHPRPTYPDQAEGHPTILWAVCPKGVGSGLSTEAEAAGLAPAAFQRYAENAKENASISQLLKGSLDLQLVAARLKPGPEPGN